ncbi:DUF6000 family protein [Streptomyces sp. NPDC001093]|uniref:DUF6000 family protein n=1 Tax=Streptomyces sp. NPDC001093 TaxID=3154376 RepID=UPI0033191CE8
MTSSAGQPIVSAHLLRRLDRVTFARKLGKAASQISLRELGILLDGGWRERKTAAWLIAVAGRREFRGRLGELLVASEGFYAGQAYCVMLAIFATPADADLLVAYFDRYLLCLDLDYDQAVASARCCSTLAGQPSSWLTTALGSRGSTRPARATRPLRATGSSSAGSASSPECQALRGSVTTAPPHNQGGHRPAPSAWEAKALVRACMR